MGESQGQSILKPKVYDSDEFAIAPSPQPTENLKQSRVIVPESTVPSCTAIAPIPAKK